MAKFSGSFLVCLLAFVFCLLAFVFLESTSTLGLYVIIKQQYYSSRPFNRNLFPPDFIFGASSSAYQFEGAAYLDGKGRSIWDTFTKNHPEKIIDTSTGDVAADFYHRYKEDIQLMKKIGLDSFRFSISWPRVLPTGKIKGGVNQQGVQFYNNLINELLSNGIVPMVTIFHWDMPQALEDEYGGFRNRNIVKDYQQYADFLFKTFGARVKNWLTLNEPLVFTTIGYDLGLNAPGRCSDYVGNCTAGDSATEPYIVGHNLLLAHSATVKLYKEKYQVSQKGKIGITLVTDWYIPKFNTQSSREATARALDFSLGWFLHPITYGDYPKTMQSIVKNRLPKFTKFESDSLKGSFDFLGLNYYGANYVDALPLATVNLSYYADIHANLTTERNGIPIGQPTRASSVFMYSKGIRELLIYIKDEYKNPLIYITENGVNDPNTLPFNETIMDSIRIRYHHDHLWYILKSIEEGANVKAYYIWALLDNFNWCLGYNNLFGLTYVDFKNNLERQLKYSAYWFKSFLLK